MEDQTFKELDTNLDLLQRKYPQLLNPGVENNVRESQETQNMVSFGEVLKMDESKAFEYQTAGADNLGHSIISKSMRKSYFTRNDNFKVCVRIRPLEDKERRQYRCSKLADANICITHDEYSIKLKEDKLVYDYAGKHGQGYYFDYVFGSQIANQYVYDQALKPMLPNIFDGFNVTCMAYGITGAGKTYTMLGNTMNVNQRKNCQEVEGISELAMSYIFNVINKETNSVNPNPAVPKSKYKIKISYLEVYNEQIRDLLREDKCINLFILEDVKHGIIVPGLKECEVKNVSEIISLINKGNSRRTMASTHSNKFSSRSHAIIQISMEKTDFSRSENGRCSPISSSEPSVVYSKLTLVDLAGSEKEDEDDCIQDKHRLEGSNINKSLLALGNCIKILSQIKSNKNGLREAKFVPYRDSKLTRLLKDSLGGNTKTLMLACVTPSYMHYEETLNTLKYAVRARKIQNPAKRNVKGDKKSITKLKKLIGELKIEIVSIKDELREIQDSSDGAEPTTTLVSQRRQSLAAPDLYDFNSEDYVEVLCCTKNLTQEQNRTKTLQKFLKYEFIYLQKVLSNRNEDENNDSQKQLSMYFEELLQTLKDKVRLTKNKAEIDNAIQESSKATESNNSELMEYYDIDFGSLLEENKLAAETNEKDTEMLIQNIRSQMGTISPDSGPTKENVPQNTHYLNQRELEVQKGNLDLKIENLELRQKLAEIRSVHCDDNKITSLQQQKYNMLQKQQQVQSDLHKYQNQIFLRNKEIMEHKKSATSNVNNLVIHFQTEILNQMQERISEIEMHKKDPQLEFRHGESCDHDVPEHSMSERSVIEHSISESSVSKPMIQDQNESQNESIDEIELKHQIKSNPVSLKDTVLNKSLLKHQVKADIYQGEIEQIQAEKDRIQIEIADAKQIEEKRKHERELLEMEIQNIQKSQFKQLKDAEREAEELDRLRIQRQEMLRQREAQLLQQKEVEQQIEALRIEREQLEIAKQEQLKIEKIKEQTEELE